MTLLEELYLVAKRLPCTCWNNSHWDQKTQARVIDEKCHRCRAIERYEAEIADPTPEP